ncbi:dynamin family protein [Mesobacillus harenae]|uniref:dynamin family protein n=1 Tax=Mesobacillus harenae TaxID=2213203 RepID=UPI0015808C94|nr:dynamin family protein [Mesobacillus harenae]
MGQTMKSQNKEVLNKIFALHSLFVENNDKDTAAKAKELGRKLLDKEFAIAFCGHFSAGKSSMINKLVGEPILPSSPIPTSANLVKIRSGEEYAKVFFKEGRPKLYPAPYEYDEVKAFCKDGYQIDSIEISKNSKVIPQEVTIMDTPGIDSTDDAHRIATESALHLADLVFYVMDYNHVQSELNFMFTRELAAAGKELYLIVNQIDKHRDIELGFESFKESVRSSFEAWGVEPAGIFYTSLRNEELQHNQFEELRLFIKDRMESRAVLLPVSVSNSAAKLAKDHLSFLSEEQQVEIERLQNVLADAPEQGKEITEKLAVSSQQIKDLDVQLKKADQEFDSEARKVLDNAYLMPFQTRELAESYLQSQEPGFKVGLLFSKQKTEQEREARLNQFYSDLEDKVQTQISWHLKELLLKKLNKKEINDLELTSMAQEFSLHAEKEILLKTLKPGARLSGEYLLNYTEEVANELKKLARTKLTLFKDRYLAVISELTAKEKKRVKEEHNRLKRLEEAQENLLSIQIKLEQNQHFTEEILSGNAEQMIDEQAISKAFFIPEKEAEIAIKADTDHQATIPSAAIKHHEETETDLQEQQQDAPDEKRVKQIVEKLTFTAEQIEEFPGLTRVARELVQKAERLTEKEFTVALFGAFSAGKSSFANALVGENILPVSPNPTTAAINKIKPVTEEFPHGTVLVQFKTERRLFEEVARSLQMFDMKAGSIKEALEKARGLKDIQQDAGAADKTHLAFLQAFTEGYTLFEHHEGQLLVTDLQEFRGFVAEEEKSCLVEYIEVYYDCSLTRHGISLVDTPGADSINTRHTGVAFDYIKNSDVILFVTYYNHAFSKADREFLIQLGRVKDSFELDKMFFIVNAVDLAGSKDEMVSVVDYVREQLALYGIRKPHVYPVSSLLALKEKQESKKNGPSLFPAFEHAFYSFISGGLMDMAIESAEAKWKQSLNLLENMITSSEEDRDVKEQKRRSLETEKSDMIHNLREHSPELLVKRLSQESDELTYYIKQRVFFRFGDFFRESFHPSVIKDDGRNLNKALQGALHDLLESIGYDFAQELRATSLRLEVFIGKQLKELQQTLRKEIKDGNAKIPISEVELGDIPAPNFENAFKDTDPDSFKKALSLFKNPKSFFEKNEKVLMANELEKGIQLPAEQYLESGNSKMKDHYTQALETEFNRILAEIEVQLEEYVTGLVYALNDEFPVDVLKEALASIRASAEGRA